MESFLRGSPRRLALTERRAASAIGTDSEAQGQHRTSPRAQQRVQDRRWVIAVLKWITHGQATVPTLDAGNLILIGSRDRDSEVTCMPLPVGNLELPEIDLDQSALHHL